MSLNKNEKVLDKWVGWGILFFMSGKKVRKKKKTTVAVKDKTIYCTKFEQQIRDIIIELVPLNQRKELAWTKIAKILGVSSKTLQRWRTPGSDYYVEDFAKAISHSEKLMRENIDLGKINAGVIKRAQGYKKVKVIKEPFMDGPELPSFSRYTKKALVNWAKRTLKLKLDPKITKGDMEEAIQLLA